MPLWTPADLTTGPRAWYDAQDSATITQSGGLVSQWGDKSGNGLHIVQATSAAQPLLSSTALGGARAGIVFDGVDDFLRNVSFSLAGDFAVFLVAEHPNTADPNFGRIVSMAASSNADWGSTSAAVPFEYQRFASPSGIWSEANGVSSFGAAWPEDTPGLFASIADPVAGTWRMWANGTDTSGISTTRSVAITRFALGGQAGNYNGDFGASHIGEVVVLDYAPTTADRQLIEGYLAHRWGLAANLPADHPYRSAAPETGGGAGDITGTLTATEAGSDTASFSGVIAVTGALAGSETGSDAAAFSGSVVAAVSGSLAATEAGADTASFAGTITPAGVSGLLAASEAGQDTATFTGESAPYGALAATETGSDSASFAGEAEYLGPLQPDGDPIWNKARAKRRKPEFLPETAFDRLVARFRAAQKAVEEAPEPQGDAPKAAAPKAVKKAVSEARKALPAVKEMAPAVDWQALLDEMERASQAQADREQQLAAMRQAIERAERAQREFEEDEEAALMLLLAA